MRRALLFMIVVLGVVWWLWPEKKAAETEIAVEGGTLAASGKFTPDAAPAAKGPPSADELKRAAQSNIRQTGPDELQIGSVRLNKRLRSISFPAKVAEKERALEYALVHESGKVHEALLATATSVADVHVAALLLDAGGLSPRLELTWRKHGGEARVQLHEVIGMKDGTLDAGWRYNGSAFIRDGFAASREGSLVALLNDPSALVNHPAAGALMKDDVFFARKEKLPPEGVQVIVHATFPPRDSGQAINE